MASAKFGKDSARDGSPSGTSSGATDSKRPKATRLKAWIPEKPDPRGNAPVLVSQLLFGLQSYVAKETGAYLGHEQWRVVAGERIAENSRAGKFYNGTLTIHVASSAWCSELSFLEQDLLAKLFRAGYEVKKLRFSIDASAKDKKPARGRAAYFERVRPEEIDPLPPELKARIEAIEDPNLRATIMAAAKASLSKAKSEEPQPIKTGSKVARQTSKRSSSS